jgi:hypothetical protein
VWWNAFKDRREALDDAEAGRTAGRIIHHVESGWVLIRTLHLACEDQRAQKDTIEGRRWHFIEYLDDDVVGAFMRCSEAVTRIPQLSDAALGEEPICALAARFDRGVAVAALAAQASVLGPPFRDAVIAVADTLVDWGTEMCTLASALARIVVAPAE